MLRLLLAGLLTLLSVVEVQALHLNSRGQAAMGVGGAVVNIDGRVIASPAGGAQWIDDDRIVYQLCTSHCVIQTFNQATGEYINVADRGANFVSAGGGVWAAWLGGVGIYTSSGINLPISGLGPIGPDGAMAFKVLYHSAGPWDVLERDESRWRLTDGDASDISLLGGGRALWRADNRVWTKNLPTVTLLSGDAWWLRAIVIDGQLWVVYQSGLMGGALVMHPSNSHTGYIVAPSLSQTYRPDVRQLANGLVRVAWATREDEGPGTLAVKDIDLAAARVALGIVLDDPIKIDEPIKEEEPIKQDMRLPAAVCQSLRDERAKYPADFRQFNCGQPGNPSCPLGKMLNAVAWKHRAEGFGLNRKDFGAYAVSPVGPIAFDILQRGTIIWDVLVAAGESTGVNCGDGEDTEHAWDSGYRARRPFVAAADPGGTIDPPPSEDIEKLKAELAVARRNLADMNAQVHITERQRDIALGRVAELESAIDHLQAQRAGIEQERDEARSERDALRNSLDNVRCEAKLPSWAKSLGIKVSCEVKR